MKIGRRLLKMEVGDLVRVVAESKSYDIPCKVVGVETRHRPRGLSAALARGHDFLSAPPRAFMRCLRPAIRQALQTASSSKMIRGR